VLLQTFEGAGGRSFAKIAPLELQPSDGGSMVQMHSLYGCTEYWFAQDTLPFLLGLSDVDVYLQDFTADLLDFVTSSNFERKKRFLLTCNGTDSRILLNGT